MIDNYAQADAQSEDFGAKTFAKYWYQYNWALTFLLENSLSNDKCSISIECHEDVMLITNKDIDTSELELYQVKERTDSGAISISTITYKSSERSKSIISKLVEHVKKDNIKERITKLALVSSTPFNFELLDKKQSKKLDLIKLEQLSSDEIRKINACLFSDLGIYEIPTFVEFIKAIETSDFKLHSSYALSQLVDYIDKTKPMMTSSPKIIFEALKTELIRIGTDINTYSKWDDFLKFKTLSSEQLNGIISLRTNPMSGYNNFDLRWEKVKNEVEYSSLPFNVRRGLTKSARDYHFKKASTISILFKSISNCINKACEISTAPTLMLMVDEAINALKSEQDIKEFFDGESVDYKAVVLYEFSESL